MLANLLQTAGEFSSTEYARNFQFLFYGLLTAWLVLLAFVAVLASRERKLRQEVRRLRMMLEDKEKESR